MMAGTTERDRVSTMVVGHGDSVAQDKTDEALEQVRAISRRILDGHYRNGFAKDIIVRRERSMADDEYDTFFDITIAFDAEDPNECDPGWLAAFLTELRASLVEVGIQEFPVPSYQLNSNLEQIRAAIGSVQAG